MKQTADKIFLSNNLFTGLEEEPWPGGVAIHGNKILAVGSREAVLTCRGENTKIIDVGEGLLMPGFCDGHVHFLMGALKREEAMLEEATSEQEAVDMTYQQYVAQAGLYGAADWVLGQGWCNARWKDQALPTKASLDKVFPDRPVFLLDADGHAGWINSKGLAVCGITKDTPEPAFGNIQRDETGQPTGYLIEAAMGLAGKYAYQFSEEKTRRLVKLLLPYLAENGVTMVNDMLPFFGCNIGDPAVYRNMAEQGELTVRINFADSLELPLTQAQGLQQGYKGNVVRYMGGKAFLDGIIPTHTAVMLAPYTNAPDLPYQYKTADYRLLRKQILDYHKAGLAVHLHATGDGAVRFALDCYAEAVQEHGVTDSRLSIEHIDLCHPDDFPRFGKNGVIASVQPQHLALTKTFAECDYPPVVGKEREQYLWATKSLKDNGAVLAFGTDYPIVEVNPMVGLFRAVARQFDDLQPEGGWNPQQKLSLAQGLKAYTWGGAYKAGREQEVGTLEVGKLADLVVIEGNPFRMSHGEIKEAKIAMTVMDGNIVYQREAMI